MFEGHYFDAGWRDDDATLPSTDTDTDTGTSPRVAPRLGVSVSVSIRVWDHFFEDVDGSVHISV